MRYGPIWNCLCGREPCDGLDCGVYLPGQQPHKKPALTAIAKRAPKFAQWIRAPLPAELREPNADDAATWADDPDASASPASALGAASSAAERTL